MRIAQMIPTHDPVLDQLGKFLFLVLITEMAAVLKNGQGTLGEPFVQSLSVVGCQESVLITPKNVDRHIECIQMEINRFGAIWVMLEPCANLADPPAIGSYIICDFLS
jgi:hypothetical protein